MTAGPYVGYAYPDEVVLESLSDVRTVSGDLFADELADLTAVQSHPDPLWYRDVTGASWPCVMTRPRWAVGAQRTLWPRRVSYTVSRTGDGPLLSDPQASGVAPVAMGGEESAAAETATTDYVALVT